MKDGWHKICGYGVYVENDRVIRGTAGEGVTYRTIHPYRVCKHGYVCISGIKVSTFRYGVKRGYVTMF